MPKSSQNYKKFFILQNEFTKTARKKFITPTVSYISIAGKADISDNLSRECSNSQVVLEKLSTYEQEFTIFWQRPDLVVYHQLKGIDMHTDFLH